MMMPVLAQADEYWQLTNAPVEIKSIAEVDYPCDKLLIGCINYLSREIFIKRGLTKEMYTCILTHEQKHAKGWTHDDRPTFAYDCGDGTLITGTIDKVFGI